ncbi:unnamed protein product [Rhodiola kirilowii]
MNTVRAFLAVAVSKGWPLYSWMLIMHFFMVTWMRKSTCPFLLGFIKQKKLKERSVDYSKVYMASSKLQGSDSPDLVNH